MNNPLHLELKEKCSKYFIFKDLFHCGKTWNATHCDNEPIQSESWQAYSQLALSILDPVVDEFGLIDLTFGFCGNDLRKLILAKPNPRIAPRLDQHAAHELNLNNQLICSRLGAAVDFIVPHKSAYDVANWINSRLIFDRLYIYGDNLPIHVSVGPEMMRQLILMQTINGRRIPRKLTDEKLKALRMAE
ncbi:hypothetical protein [Shewanella algae]|uniref:hypothetical protein n=1 Tax=Shewanella algae TaxID=38313 RepID=UPI003003EBA3